MDTLRALKAAIQEVTWNMQDDLRRGVAADNTAEVDDALGWTMRFLRAAEAQKMATMRRCVEAYPRLGQLVEWQTTDLRLRGGLAPIRQQAVDLAKAEVLQELRLIQQDEGEAEEQTQRVRRARVEVRLRRLRPGATTAVAALRCGDGRMVSDAAGIAAELRRHWCEVFAERRVDEPALSTWLSEAEDIDGAFSTLAADAWTARREEVARAVKSAPATMPGPDGIPFVAWKRLGHLAVDTLTAAAAVLGQEDAREVLVVAMELDVSTTHDFNVGSMVFLPKKPAGNDPLFGDYYTAADMRPLTIVNTDNRLITNAYRLRAEPALAAWISDMQRGFLSDRSSPTWLTWNMTPRKSR
jgi:hypothetical protein